MVRIKVLETRRAMTKPIKHKIRATAISLSLSKLILVNMLVKLDATSFGILVSAIATP